MSTKKGSVLCLQLLVQVDRVSPVTDQQTRYRPSDTLIKMMHVYYRIQYKIYHQRQVFRFIYQDIK